MTGMGIPGVDGSGIGGGSVHGLLGAYVLNAIAPSERQAFDAHLEQCDECRAEVADLREVAASLADAEASSPPESLRTRVFDEISRTPQAVPGEGDVAGGGTSGGSLTHISRRQRPLLWIAAAAATAAVVTGVGIGIGASHGPSPSELAFEHAAMMVATAPDAHAMDLDLGSAHVVMSESMDAVVAMGADAPDPGDGMAYQLWVVTRTGEYKPGPTFSPDDGDFITMMHGAAADDVVAYCVTVEPQGGSAHPTSAPVAIARL